MAACPDAAAISTGLAVAAFEDVDGLKAVLVVMGVEQCQLLAAVDGIRGIVNVEHDALGIHALEAAAKQIDLYRTRFLGHKFVSSGGPE